MRQSTDWYPTSYEDAPPLGNCNDAFRLEQGYCLPDSPSSRSIPLH